MAAHAIQRDLSSYPLQGKAPAARVELDTTLSGPLGGSPPRHRRIPESIRIEKDARGPHAAQVTLLRTSRRVARGGARRRFLVLPLLGALLLAGCGGGGGGAVKPNIPPPPPPPPVCTNPQPSTAPLCSTGGFEQGGAWSQNTSTCQWSYSGGICPQANYQLTDTNAAPAISAGLTGKGVGVVVFDSAGMDPQNPALKGQIYSANDYVQTSDFAPGSNYKFSPNIPDPYGHGTMVSEVIAGLPYLITDNIPYGGGIAPGVNLYLARVMDDLGNVDFNAVIRGVAALNIPGGPMIFNNSWGDNGSITVGDNPNNYIFMQQTYDPVVANGRLVVFAAGNFSLSSVSREAGAPYYFPELQKGWLAVVAVNGTNDTQLASYSNSCGLAAQWCLAAPGDVLLVTPGSTSTSSHLGSAAGTSFAAPAVSAAAALVWQEFPFFTNDNIRQTILTTATNIGPSSTFGWGLLNIGKAINGPGQFAFGDFNVNMLGQNATFSNNISGTGSLVMTGTGTLTLTGTDTYQGSTIINGAQLNVDGSIVSTVTTGSSGVLSGTGTINGNVQDNGTVLVGTSILSINGDYVQATTANLDDNLGYDLLVSGTANIAGTLMVIEPKGYITKAQELVLQANGGLSGQFSNLTSPGLLLTATLSYSATQALINIQSIHAAAVGAFEQAPVTQLGAADLDAALAVADRWSVLAPAQRSVAQQHFLDTAGAIQRLPSVAAGISTLNSLSGAAYTTGQALALSADQQANDLLMRRLGDVADGNPAGVWAAASAGGMDLHQTGWQGASGTSSLAMAGASARWDQLTVGAALLGQRGSEQLDTYGGNVYLRSAGVAFYGVAAIGHDWFLKGALSALGGSENVNRTLELGSAGTPSVGSRLHLSATSLQAELGRALAVDHLILTPHLLADVTRLEEGRFDESATDTSGFGLIGQSSTLTQSRAGAGVSVQWQASGTTGVVQIGGGIDALAAISAPHPVITAAYTGAPGAALPLEGARLGGSELRGHLGVDLTLRDGWTFELDAAAEQGSVVHDHSIGVGAGYRF